MTFALNATKLESIFDKAVIAKQGTSALLKELEGLSLKNESHVDKVRREVVLGGIAAHAGKDKAYAIDLLDNKSKWNPETKDSDKKRTFAEQQSYISGYNLWSYVMRTLKAPVSEYAALRMKAKRKANAGKAAESNDTDKAIADLPESIRKAFDAKVAAARIDFIQEPSKALLACPKVESRDEVNQRALHYAELLAAELNQNPQAPYGDLRPLYLDFAAKVRLIVSGKQEPTKPESKPIPAPSQPSVAAKIKQTIIARKQAKHAK